MKFSFRFWLVVAASIALSVPVSAQELSGRLAEWRLRRALKANLAATLSDAGAMRLHPKTTPLQTYWIAVAQTEPPADESAASPTRPVPLPGAVPLDKKVGITAYADLSFGFDNEKNVQNLPAPTAVQIRRRIRVLNISAEYPLAVRTNLALGIPLISQSAKVTGGGSSANFRGNGLGDLSLLIERRSRESQNGVEGAVALGLVVPTGKDPFEVGPDELATGNGFYQPFVRLSVRELRVPLQFFASVNYGKSLSRTVAGQKLRLPDSYGGEVGFAYAIGPEFAVSTTLSANRLSSPFLTSSGEHTAYLSQALSYNSGDVTSLRAAVDLGLTDASTDAFVGLSLRHKF